jgi:hypothetical protein
VRDLLARVSAGQAGGPAGASDNKTSQEDRMAPADRGSFWQEVGHGLRRLFGDEWPRPHDAFAALLDALVRGKKLQDELVAVESDASAVSTRDPQAEEAQLAKHELDTARADLPDFERALVDAWERSGGSTAEVPYRSTDPIEDRAADVLIRYLVTTDVATVRSEEIGSEQYTYFVGVQWPTLFELAEHLGIELRAALERGAQQHDPRA